MVTRVCLGGEYREFAAIIMPYLIYRAPVQPHWPDTNVADEFEGDVLNWCWMRRFQAEPGYERYVLEA